MRVYYMFETYSNLFGILTYQYITSIKDSWYTFLKKSELIWNNNIAQSSGRKLNSKGQTSETEGCS